MNVQLHQRFIRNLKDRRLDLGLTQRDVAKRLQMSQPSYAQIEAGRTNPSLNTVEKVEVALDCAPGQLLATSEKMAVA